MQSLVQRYALVACAVIGVLTTPTDARAQKALVYCPVSVDATGCNTIAAALAASHPLGVDRGFDGTGGTVDLKTVDLFNYSVFVVPSLADNASTQPYAFLRDAAVVEHLKAALIGRIALWSGSPDQGATNRSAKDALIQNLAGYAGGAFATARGPGLVALLDASSSATSRYDWLRAIVPLGVSADGTLLSYNSVRALNATATGILTSGAGAIAYDNMATFGFAVPTGAPGASLDAVGQTGTPQGGQVVLVTMEAGNTSQATVRTDKDDYAPGETVTITGSGWQPGETVRLTLHEDPLVHDDRVLTATADASGNFTNTQFSPEVHHIGVRFVVTALGEGSGRRAQTTFTDGNRVTFSTTANGAAVGSFGTVAPNQCVNAFVQERQGTNLDTDGHDARNVALSSVPLGATFFAGSGCVGGGITSITIAGNAVSAAFSFRIAATGSYTIHGNGGLSGNNNADATVSVVTANNAPVANDDSYPTNEDQTLNVPAPGILGNDTDADGNTLTAVLAAGPDVAHGTLTLNPNGSFTFVPVANFFGTATFTYRASDGTTTSNVATVTITVAAVNDPPTFNLIASHTSNEDAGAQSVPNALTARSAGPPNESSQTLTLTVTNDNNALFAAQPAIDGAGTLTYTAAPNASGTATVTASLSDGTDATAKTLTVTVNDVNDAPSFAKGADQTVNEDSGPKTVPGWATAISAGPPDEVGQTVTFEITNNTNAALFSAGPSVASDGTLTFTPAANTSGTATITLRAKDTGGVLNGGIDVSPTQSFLITVNEVNDAPTFTLIGNQAVNEDAGGQTVPNAVTGASAGPNESGQTLTLTVTNDNNGLFSAQPAINLGTGQLTYTPAADAFGTAIVTVRLADNGGTANGGVDFTEHTFTVTVNPVNDAPSFTKGADETILEDAGPRTVTNWATSISKGPANESGQTLTFLVTTTNDELFSSLPAISPSGTLTYTAAANANGSAIVTVVLKDDGGVANGGVDASAPQTFNITVTAVNDAPTYVKGADPTVNEDAGPQTVNGWATSISKGPPDENGQTLTFSVTTNSNAALFSAGPSVDPATGTLTYTPAPDAFGSADITLRLSDNGGTANGGVDFSEQTFKITINAVNDAPNFTKGADRTVLEDAGPQTVSPWATGISAGPANESGQAVAFNITGNTNPGLFSAPPAVSSTGVLTFTPAANAFGTATITLVAKDDGGTANGGVDTSAPQSFDITITPVNDAPTYDLIPGHTSNEDAGAQSVPNALTNASPGPPNESGQTLSVTVTNNNATLFDVQPTINLMTGELTYTASPNKNGTATVTVIVKDNGGVLAGGVDQTTETLTIIVNAVNDLPVIAGFVGAPSPTAVNTTVTASGTFSDVDLGDSPPDAHVVKVDWEDGTPQTTASQSGSGTTRSFSATHSYATAGVYTLTVTVTDKATGQDVETFEYVVVYDPNAGFVTGGGWINSPAGAYVADPSLVGKANFGFVSKYKKGQSTPDGNTEFQFHAASLNFKSTAYEWLVLSGTTKAQFKGVGTVNGTAGYAFLLSALDGDNFGSKKPDTFRIKIWQISNGAVVYDNNILADELADPTTILGGGSIVIHTK